MSERSRDRDAGREGGGKKRWLAWGGWVLFAVLAGHWIFAELNKAADGTPQGLVSPDVVRSVAFWLPMLVGGATALAGMWWARRAYAKSERSSLVWLKRGFMFSIGAFVLLIIASFDAANFPREWFVVVAAGIFGAQTLLFAMAALREHRRGDVVEMRRRIGRSETAAPDEPPRVAADLPSRDA